MPVFCVCCSRCGESAASRIALHVYQDTGSAQTISNRRMSVARVA